jgi:hypothetical protein
VFPATGRHGVAEGKRGDAGQKAQAGFQLIEEGQLLFGLRVAVLAQRHFRHEQTIGTHAERLVLQIPQAAQQQTGSCQQNQRHRYLRDHQKVAEKAAWRRARTGCGQGGLRSSAMKGGNNSKKDSTDG